MATTSQEATPHGDDCGCPAAAAPAGLSGGVGELVRRHSRKLAAIARDEGLRAADAFDAVQEAFGRFLLLPDAPRLIAAPDEAQRVLVAIARNLARNWRRLSAAARPHNSDAAVLDGLASPEPGVDELLVAAEERLRLQGCVASLADLQRAVVTLRMLEEVDGEGVAAALGISPGHVAVLLHRAKASLAACMTQRSEKR
jgi:RNA polymerase sigma-70 factor (ECF subfamily)